MLGPLMNTASACLAPNLIPAELLPAWYSKGVYDHKHSESEHVLVSTQL
jgi:hypothetical protein